MYQPAYEKHIKREEWFSVFVKLGVFHESDRDRYSSSVLGFMLMSHIVRNYVHVNPSISSEVNQFLSKYSGRYLVGFHLRMSDSSSDFREIHKMERFLYFNDAMNVIDCKFIDYSRHPVLYVASDSSYVKEQIEAHSNSTVIVNRGRSLHTDHGMSDSDRLLAYHSVLFDILALSKCESLIVTKGSSFSFLAAAFLGHVPYYITRNTACYLPQNLTTLTPR